MRAVKQDVVHLSVSRQAVYSIRHRGEWADFSVKSGIGTAKGSDNWVSVTVASSFGSMQHHWSNIGSQNWAEFLHEIDRPYTMKKLMGYEEKRYRQWSEAKTIRRVKDYILDRRRQTDISMEEARTAWADLSWVNSHVGPDVFVAEVRNINILGEEPWEFLVYEDQPWVENFWNTLWVPFTTAVATNKKLSDMAYVDAD